MERMLGKANPGHRRQCRYARKGCTCFQYGGVGSRAARSRRRAQRQAERAELRRQY